MSQPASCFVHSCCNPAMANISAFLLVLISVSHQVWGQRCAQKFIGDNAQCDAYLECDEETGVTEPKMCPDGLVFKENAPYPCAYPQEVDCGRKSRQAAKRTGECPNQYALFNLNCKQYVSCVEGVAATMPCPDGLAFNDEKGICDWPDHVPGCEGVNNFRCPKGGDDPHARYGDDGDCRKFFVCIQGVPRLHSCSLGKVFNEQTGECEDPQNVPKCSNYYPRDVLDAISKLRSFDSTLL